MYASMYVYPCTCWDVYACSNYTSMQHVSTFLSPVRDVFLTTGKGCVEKNDGDKTIMEKKKKCQTTPVSRKLFKLCKKNKTYANIMKRKNNALKERKREREK